MHGMTERRLLAVRFSFHKRPVAALRRPAFHPARHTLCGFRHGCLSTSSSTTTTDAHPKKHDNPKNKAVVLFESDAINDNKFRRDLLLAYTLSVGGPTLLYGLSAYEAISIGPYWGIGASVLGGGVLLGAAKFVRDAVSRIEWQESPTPGVLVYGYTLPFRRPSPAPTFYKFGDAKLFLATPDTQELVETLLAEDKDGGHTEGFIPLEIAERRWPMGLFLRSRSEIHNRDLFLDALVDFGTGASKSKKSRKKTKPRKPKPPKKLNKGMGRTV